MIFVGMSERSSGLIRGKQICEKFLELNLKSKFYEYGDPRLFNESNETIIFIRFIDVDSANKLKNKGNQIGFDLLDRPVADQHQLEKYAKNQEIDWKKYLFDQIDFYIVNNTITKNKLLESNCQKNIYVIPHHTVNFDNERICINDVVRRVGYIGLEDQLSYKDDIKSFLSSKNIEFISCHPTTREEVTQVLKKIDIGLISVDYNQASCSVWKQYIIKYKPNTKLSNFQSFGIPTIACPYSSFKEFGENGWINASTKNEILEALENLTRNSSTSKILRDDLSNNGYKIAKKYHITDLVLNFYSKIQ